MRLSEDSIFSEPVVKLCIIVIPLCIFGLYIANHDDLARSSNAETSLEQMANTSDCHILKFMTMNHQDDWFPSKYIVIAKERMVELKC